MCLLSIVHLIEIQLQKPATRLPRRSMKIYGAPAVSADQGTHMSCLTYSSGHSLYLKVASSLLLSDQYDDSSL